ncbi:nuclear transport factor 2 family protein [Sphingopyxis sp.]|uniref:nuclear transport factor 2 family protein n=1 Tax=Sphingopyxis sp. TaxID=1908224 RepID=UPI0026149A69|nr:nuclear transport factor 2 family protein [Sphingopyxis sp.]MCW0198857.1 nuclear transport factor 2 family protein [Sphingopyxis sp.]
MSIRREIEQAEERLRQAILTSDVARLDELLSDTLIFTNQDGVRLSKPDDMAVHQSGLLKIDRLDVKGETIIRVLDSSAIVCVTVELAGTYDGNAFSGVFAYTRFWHHDEDRWQIAAAHCSSVSEDGRTDG